MNSGNTAGFPGSTRGLLEVSDSETGVRSANMPGSSNPEAQPHRRQRLGFHQSCGLAKLTVAKQKRGRGLTVCYLRPCR